MGIKRSRFKQLLRLCILSCLHFHDSPRLPGLGMVVVSSSCSVKTLPSLVLVFKFHFTESRTKKKLRGDRAIWRGTMGARTNIFFFPVVAVNRTVLPLTTTNQSLPAWGAIVCHSVINSLIRFNESIGIVVLSLHWQPKSCVNYLFSVGSTSYMYLQEKQVESSSGALEERAGCPASCTRLISAYLL